MWVRFCLQMITAVQRKALSDEDVRTNQQFAKLFEDTIKVCLLVGIEFFALHPQVLSRSHSNRPNMLHDSGLHVYWRTRSYKTRESIPLNTAPTLLFLMESRSMYFTLFVCLFVGLKVKHQIRQLWMSFVCIRTKFALFRICNRYKWILNIVLNWFSEFLVQASQPVSVLSFKRSFRYWNTRRWQYPGSSWILFLQQAVK